MFGIVDQYDATELHFPFVLEIDVVWEIAVRVAHPFCVPEGGRFAVEHKGSSAVFSLTCGLLRAKSGDAPFFLWNLGVDVRHEGLHALHILGVNGRCHVLRVELCECFVGGKKVARLEVFERDGRSPLGFYVTTSLHKGGWFTIVGELGLVSVVARAFGSATIGVSKGELVAIEPFSSLHGAGEDTTIVGFVGHVSLAGGTTCELF